MTIPQRMHDVTDERSSADRTSVKIGTACVIIGSLTVFAARATHGDLPTDTGANTLSYVASYPIYHIVHLVANLGVLIWAVGLYALSSSFKQPVAQAIGRIATAAAIIGAAVYIVDFSIDGYALASLADRWQDASQAERADLAFGSELVETALGGISLGSLLILWGVVPTLDGVALAREGYSRWLSGTGVIIGVAMFSTAVAQFVVSVQQTGETALGLAVYAIIPLAALLWSAFLGIAIWQRTRVGITVAVAAGRC
ncbi:MAG: hypothetical protein ACRDT6_15045 [Micromonosporaceae bacterium]